MFRNPFLLLLHLVNGHLEFVQVIRNITYEEIEEALGIGSHAVHSMLHDHLKLRKVVSRWIPHLLSEQLKQDRVDWCQFMLEKFHNGQSRYVGDIVTGDETWVYSYDPETKQQSTVWAFDEEKLPTKVVRSKSAAKQMLAVFFRRSGLVASVALERNTTVTSKWYCEVGLSKVFEKLEAQRPNVGLRGVLLHHDNARAHTAARTIDYLQEKGVQLVPHPPYSPDLAPCDFFLFPYSKKFFEEEDSKVRMQQQPL